MTESCGEPDPAESVARPFVAPRVREGSGSFRPMLADSFQEWLDSDSRCFAILGGHGSGRSTALAFLRREFGVEGIEWFDDGLPVGDSTGPRVVYAAHPSRDRRAVVRSVRTVRLEPWGDDQLLEWLGQVASEQRASIWTRLQRTPRVRRWPDGNAALWGIALGRMAADDALASPKQAVFDWLAEHLGPRGLERARLVALDSLTSRNRSYELRHQRLLRRLTRETPAARPVLLKATVRDSLAASVLATDLDCGRGRPLVEKVRAIPDRVLNDAVAHVRALRRAPSTVPVGGVTWSVLTRAEPGWRPNRIEGVRLDGARLEGVAWSGIELPNPRVYDCNLLDARLDRADLNRCIARRTTFRRATLSDANLDGCDFEKVVLVDTDLRRTSMLRGSLYLVSMLRASARETRFDGASFRRVDMRHASFVDASFRSSRLSSVDVDDAAFTGCDFHFACVSNVDFEKARLLRNIRADKAHLTSCRFDESDIEGLDLREARILNCTFTNAWIRGLDLRRARLRGVGLHGVDFEGADLRDADLGHVSFRKETSRADPVGRSTAREIAWTAFYADEFDERISTSPDIRPFANLRGADLRGADVWSTDFYLVDLRGARFDPDQGRHFARCRAILY